VKKFRVLFVLFIGLLFVGFSAMAQENPMKKKGRSYEIPAQQPSFSLARTEQSQANEQTKAQEATTATTTEKKEAETTEEQKIIIFTLAPIVELEICGVRLSLVIEPIGYGYPYYFRPWYYGWWPGSYFYGYRNWWWNAREWNRWGWYKPHNRNYENTNPIHASQLKDPRRINTVPSAAQSQSNQVKSYPSRKSVTRAQSPAQQKFNGRIDSRYTNAKPNPFLRKSNSTAPRTAANPRQFYSRTQNTRTSPSRISNQSRPASSRATLRQNLSRASSHRMSGPSRSSASRSSARPTAVRSSGVSRSSAARASAPRVSSPRGGGVRRK
jgi:hypothetical protein